MRIGVWGGGSLGLLWASRLASLFPETVLVTRTREQADAVREEGIQVIRLDGKVERVPVQVVESDRVSSPLDVIMLMVKQRDFASAFHKAVSVCSRAGVIVCWQNGVGHEAVVKKMARIPVVYGAVTTEGALREDAATVRHTGTGKTWMGPLFGMGDVHPRSLRSIVVEADRRWCPVELVVDIQPRIWEKLLINSVINPLTALLEVKNGDLLHLPDSRRLMWAALEEAVAVARTKGIRYEVEDLYRKVEEICRKTAANRSSMYQDLMRGCETEVDWINGGIVKAGRLHDIPTPIHETLMRLMHAKEGRNRQREG